MAKDHYYSESRAKSIMKSSLQTKDLWLYELAKFVRDEAVLFTES